MCVCAHVCACVCVCVCACRPTGKLNTICICCQDGKLKVKYIMYIYCQKKLNKK